MTTIRQALHAVMKDVGAVKKGDRNTQGNFNFRGIDAVTNAVYPALVEHGVIVAPKVLSYNYGTVVVGHKRTEMGHARLTVEFTFYGPEDDQIVAVTAGEAFDSGDKATAKAHSVAFRTALLQTLCLPTDEPDPDSASYERASKTPEELAQDRLLEVCGILGLDTRAAAQRFKDEIGADIRQADAASITAFAESLLKEGVPA
ncbi:ERF family protein [Mycolicibacterium fortuitum]|uniref:ERF family protein n=1 Tax=Mycolicibacterium fortuitum TaxID=1766 RepID=A0AAE4V6P1_MYCFO|nr:ERF family protein [Mycolicibacterium fortuitum]MDV7194639.1 ERF family protein [Mycolicibacterium fortuitum]MDV7208639.1 ERF family protein [Mycolicibacterium fortuitum]MDV7230536.1 ERF family protein [Mycolicibacterium fortuitum]MDV7261857.1 ERF family protein [Mycolicibacterium fortuitum]MDV7287033.1 ERF family protein [Mycolicibacterium fortuitum]